MHVVQEEDPAPETAQDLLHRGAVEALVAAGRRALETVEHAGAVPVGLEAADEPRPRVGEALVVEVDRVLGGEHHAHPERARLLEEGEERELRRRIRDRREVAEDLVHVEQRPEAGRPGLGPHPPEHLVQQERDEEHALGVGQVSDREDRGAGLALGRVEERADVERLALEPGVEARRGEEVVEPGRQLEPVLSREERLEVQRAHLGDRRALDLLDEPGQVEVAALSPRGLEELREQDVLAALEGVRLDPEESEEARGGGPDAVAEQLGVVAHGGRRGRERLDDRDRKPRGAAGRVDGDVGRVAEPPDSRAVLAPRREPLSPELRLLRGVRVHREPLPARVVLVDPRGEVFRAELREGEAEIREVALRVDEEHGDAVEQGLLDEGEAEARLAAPRHPDAHRVGDEILRVVEQEARSGFLGGEIVGSPEIEDAELLEVSGGRPRCGRCRRTLRGRGARGPARLGPGRLTRAGRH